MRAGRKKTLEAAPAQPGLLALQVVILSAALFLSPLVAGRLTPIPTLSVQALVLVTALIWIVRAARAGSLDLPGGRIVLFSGIFFALLVLSAFDSVSLHASLRELVNIACYLLVFLITAGLSCSRRVLYGVLASLAISAALVGALGFNEYALGTSAGQRVFSTFFNPDFLAGFMALMLPIVLAWYLSRTPPAISVIAGLLLLLVLANILMSGSRFGAVASVSGVAVFMALALLSRSFGKAQLIRMSVLVLPILVVCLFLGKPLAGRVSSVKAESHSGGFRIYTWKGTARMCEAHPVNGTGIGTFEVAYPKYAIVGYTKLAHNSYLQLAAEAGPLAAAGLLGLLGLFTLPAAASLLRRRVAWNRDEPSNACEYPWMPQSGLMVSGLLAGAAASMARNLVDSDWYVTAIGISFWAILGATVALGRPAPPGNVKLSRAYSGVGIALLALALLGILAMLGGELYLARGDRRLAARDVEGTEASYANAAGLDPFNPEPHRRLRRLYLLLADVSGDLSYAEQAEREIRKAIRLEPTDPKNYYQLARVCERYPRNEDAIRAFQAAIERAPNALEPLLALARRYEAAGREKDALWVWKRMVALEDSPYGRIRATPEFAEPRYIFAHEALGREFEQRGDRKSACREYTKALEEIERYQESMKAVGAVLGAVGRRDSRMEQQVEELRTDLTRRLKALEAAPIH